MPNVHSAPENYEYQPLNAQAFYHKLGRMKADLLRGLMDGSDMQRETDIAHIITIQNIQNKLLDKLNPLPTGVR